VAISSEETINPKMTKNLVDKTMKDLKFISKEY
jgi:hypothetical protein